MLLHNGCWKTCQFGVSLVAIDHKKKQHLLKGHQSLHLNLYLSKWNVFHINTIVEGSYNLVINTQQSSSCWRASITLPESILIKWNVFHINTIVEGSYNLVINTQQSSSCWRASITPLESILIEWNVFHINTIVKEGSYNLVINTQQSSSSWRASTTPPESIVIKVKCFSYQYNC